MQSQERELIEGLFSRLKAYEAQPRDPEAERLIAGLVASQPGSPYMLAQTVLVQEHALKAAQARIAELEAKAAAAPPPSFLGSAPKIGPWGAAPAAPQPPSAPPAAAPWQQQPSAAPAPSGTGSFLRSAMTTAAGVAGGALLFDGIRSLFGHSSPFGMGSFGPSTTIIEETAPTPLAPPDQVSSADLAQDDGAANNYDTGSGDSYDTSWDNGGDDSGGDFGGDSPFDSSDEV
jgi:hypothetical protein